MRRVFPILLLLGVQAVLAQNATDVANGQAFANSVAPTSPSQIVNPAGVSSSAWSSQTNTPSSVPAGLAGFSSPNTDASLYGTAQSTSLSAMGDQTMIDCASFIPGSDPYQNQACAAVNFLNNQCMQATTGEQSVLGTTGTTQGSSANCAGTYGAGQSQFGYGNQITSSDPMFSGALGLGGSAGNVLQQTCTPKTVVTQPAQYATNTCIVSVNTEDNACSQYLNTSVTNTIAQALATQNCPDGGTLSGGECVHSIIYNPTISCPAGYFQGGPNADECIQINTLQGTQYCPAGFGMGSTSTGTPVCVPLTLWDNCPAPDVYENMPLVTEVYTIGSYCIPIYLPLQSCPSGYTFDGTQCTETVTTGLNYSCPSGGSLQGQTCATTTDTSTTTTYSCPAGQTLNGTNCIKQVLTTTWSDTCGIYETSAGATLPVPSQ